MRACYLILPLLVCAFWAVPVPGVADTLPTATVWRDSGSKPFSTTEFEHVLQQLKTERAALEAEWKALVKRSAAGIAPGRARSRTGNPIERYARAASSKAAPRRRPLPRNSTSIAKRSNLLPVEPGKTQEAPLSFEDRASWLFQSRNPWILSRRPTPFSGPAASSEALASFRLVDLKGKKAEARAPVQYLMAICLLHLGKADEAVPLLRDVANSRGDEKLAGYAQWQLEMVRWQRDVQEKLQGHRERRLALEKRI